MPSNDLKEQMMYDALYGTRDKIEVAVPITYKSRKVGGIPDSMEGPFGVFLHKLPVSLMVTSKRRIMHDIAAVDMADISIAEGHVRQPRILLPTYDQITGLPMAFPIVGKNCKHIDCFDARTYYMTFEGDAQYNGEDNICLICGQPLPVDEIYLDRFMMSLLQDKPRDDNFMMEVTLSDCHEF